MQQQKNKMVPVPEKLIRQTWLLCFGFIRKKCRHFYFHTKESFGQPKREIIVCRVEEACDSLEDTRTHFSDALERFKNIIVVEDEALEKRYRLLKMQFDISVTKANGVRDNIRLIEEVSEALFSEWESELDQYSSRSLKSQSRRQLKLTRQQYARLIKAMYKAESKIKPVLAAFRDQVLFLKHNLNAQAIASLQHELLEITVDISQLIMAMEHSISEANSFVNVLLDQKSLPKPDSV